jgi:hypothetical protein
MGKSLESAAFPKCDETMRFANLEFFSNSKIFLVPSSLKKK